MCSVIEKKSDTTDDTVEQALLQAPKCFGRLKTMTFL